MLCNMDERPRLQKKRRRRVQTDPTPQQVSLAPFLCMCWSCWSRSPLQCRSNGVLRSSAAPGGLHGNLVMSSQAHSLACGVLHV